MKLEYYMVTAVENCRQNEDIPLQRNDEVLLCSDGLTDMVPEEGIVKVLKTNKTVKEKTRALVKLALDNGGYDNVTVMLFHVCRE